MNMLGGLLGGMFDKEKITHDIIQNALEEIAVELGCTHEDFFLMIKPTDASFEMRFYIYKFENKIPKLVREITLKEILDDSND